MKNYKIENWGTIRDHFNQVQKTSLHVSIASVNKENYPTVTPIGSFFLNGDQTGFYFERYASKLPNNFKANKKVCVLGVNSSKRFWFVSLIKNRFKVSPGMKLYGTLQEKRKATEIEKQRLLRRMRIGKMTKGYQYLWSDMDYVRPIFFEKVEKINLGKMTKDN